MPERAGEDRLVSIKDHPNRVLSTLGGAVEHLLALNKVNATYARWNSCNDIIEFLEGCFKDLNVNVLVEDEEMERIPADGRLVVVSNHPYGGVEGLILGWLLKQARPDVKIMANYLLKPIKNLREMFIFVDPFGTSKAVSANLRPLKESMAWVKQDGCLGVFPAGEVSSLNLQKRTITDPVWSTTVARIVTKTQAPVLPVYFSGHNSPLFQLAGLVHPRLRTAMLPRELYRRKNQDIRVRIGQVMPFEQLKMFEDDQALTAYLRLRTYLLQKNDRSDKPRLGGFVRRGPKVGETMEIAPETPPDQVALEIDRLPESQVLVRSRKEVVYQAEADQIPSVLREIGRLREITFRQVGEGTGKDLDIDVYDSYYTHLVLWDESARQLVGSYRLGRVDEILAQRGRKGLYTHSLFKFKKEFFDQVTPALELGRSFVRPEYQKSYAPLLLLWKAISAYLVKYPRYRFLFGPVSINSEYRAICRRLMIDFLKSNRFLPTLAKLVKPRTPARFKPLKTCDHEPVIEFLDTVENLSDLIGCMEDDQKGIPVLLRQYIRHGGYLVGFNLDPNFGDCLDGLIVVDAPKTDFKTLERYMGKEGVREYLSYHSRI